MVQLLGLLIVTILTASGFGWIWSIGRWKQGLPLLEREPRRPAPWGLFDVVAGALLTLVGIIMALLLVRELGWLPTTSKDALPTLSALRASTLTEAVAKLLGLSVVALLIAFRTGATLRDFGWSARSLLQDIGTGALAFAMLAPLVFGLKAILVQFYPSEHPLIAMLKSHPDPQLFAIIAFSAAVAAPLAEEFFFRVLLQGWLEEALQNRGNLRECLLGTLYPDIEVLPLLEPVEPPAFEPASEPKVVIAPDSIDAEAPPKARPEWSQRIAAWAAIGISSLFFALLHGQDWIPLMILAIGLGYVYQRTHRIVPSLTVHVLLNSFTVLALAAEIFGKPAA
jgi:membrane protease YdiL (CAAX protease family)